MLKRTLYFGNPAYLSTANQQMMITLADTGYKTTAPIEDIGVVVLDHQQITITQALMGRLLENNVALITCNDSHHPTGLLLNLDGNTLQSRIFNAQIEASEPLKKQLWQQTIVAKIQNQAVALACIRRGEGLERPLLQMAKEVRSGDADNLEAQAAAYYWKLFWPDLPDFTRDRFGDPPNNLLNYAYALLRATMARALVGSGLLPTLGIHHSNQYNAYCLADDIMEPYRPYADMLTAGIATDVKNMELIPAVKKQLLGLMAMDVQIQTGEGSGLQRSPLMNAMSRTTASLSRCFEGDARRIVYPAMQRPD